MMTIFRSNRSLAFLALLLAAAWKVALLIWDVVPFNADEAVVGLMARHILSGERPVFFYGQAYMGSLDAFLTAFCFYLFGQHVWCIRLVQIVLYLGTVGTTILLGKEAFSSQNVGILAAFFLAIPTVNVTLYTTASLGGYGEALLLGNLMVWIALVTNRRSIGDINARFPAGWLVFWGVLAGMGLWANGLTLVYSVPTGVYLLWKIWQHKRAWLVSFLLVVGVCFLLGSLPWWAFALANGFDRLILELFGTAVAVEPEPWLARTGNHLVNFLALGISVIFGFRPPWAVKWLVLPAIPFVLVLWGSVVVFLWKRLREKSVQGSSYRLLVAIGATLMAGFLFTPFGVDPSGRYFLPLAVPLALFAAKFILSTSRRSWQSAALSILLVGYQFAGTVQCAMLNPPGLTTQFYEPTIIDHSVDQELIAFLRGAGEIRGYSNYWVTYPLAFLSEEEIIFAPRLPYHLDLKYTPRDDRYTAYLETVEKSSTTAYITTRNPTLDQLIRAQLVNLEVSWTEAKIGDYQVFYQLSRAVRPQELGLGELRE